MLICELFTEIWKLDIFIPKLVSRTFFVFWNSGQGKLRGSRVFKDGQGCHGGQVWLMMVKDGQRWFKLLNVLHICLFLEASDYLAQQLADKSGTYYCL